MRPHTIALIAALTFAPPGAAAELNPQQAKLAKRLLDEGKLVSEIAETFGVHVATIYRLGAAT